MINNQNLISKGSFASVFKYHDPSTNHTLALKRFESDRFSVAHATREVNALLYLGSHSNIVELISETDCTGQAEFYCIALTYCPLTLRDVFEGHLVAFEEPVVKCCVYQLVLGVNFIHSHGILHRDLKPENVLVREDGLLKIADFGCSCFANENVTQETREDINEDWEYEEISPIGTRWYLPPDILLSCRTLDFAQDIWSLGCIFAEFHTPSHEPLFRTDSDIEQLALIFRELGPVNETDWPELPTLPDYGKLSFFALQPSSPRSFSSSMSSSENHLSSAFTPNITFDIFLFTTLPTFSDLLKNMIIYSASRRIIAKEILKHPYVEGCEKEDDLGMIMRSRVDLVGIVKKVELKRETASKGDMDE